MKEKPIKDMYVIGCDFYPFPHHERYDQGKLVCIRCEFNKKFSCEIPIDEFFDKLYRGKVNIIAYKKEDMEELLKEVKHLNDWFKNSREGKYHFYVRRLNKGTNTFRLIRTNSSGNFHSQNKKLMGYYFDIKPAKGYIKQPH